jgi:hypothetical protein
MSAIVEDFKFTVTTSQRHADHVLIACQDLADLENLISGMGSLESLRFDRVSLIVADDNNITWHISFALLRRVARLSHLHKREP